MEIDITRLFNGETDLWPYSHSQAEGGPNAGPNTWEAAKDSSRDAPFLVEPDQLQAMRDHARGFGAWSPQEIAAWSDVELNALFLQMAAGDIRHSPVNGQSLAEADWQAWRLWAEDHGGSFYLNDDDKPTSVWYYLGN